jgi:hypothetical protein|tara:strand:- start:2563 stop:2796 length:234 start_codon:yes stop_codon:yes gene_type:complete
MNIIKIFTMGMTFYNLNKGMANDGKKIMEEGIDVLEAISAAIKDGKVTQKEKNAIISEIQQFSKASIKALDSIKMPE